MTRIATVELHKEELKFSAGHFMIVSGLERETMHGHDYQIQVSFNTTITENGMAFDCRTYKAALLRLCSSLDYRFILPAESVYLRLEETDTHYIAHMQQEQIPFLKRDAIALPICNVTMEELSNWFLQQLIQDRLMLKKDGIHGITVKVFNGRGESGATTWQNHSKDTAVEA